jgi:hypothetical protein
MAEIKKLGWTGALFALTIFSLGFMFGGIFHHAVMPAALSAPPPIVTKLPPPALSAELTKVVEGLSVLRADISEIRSELAEMNATLQRMVVMTNRKR